MDQDQRLHLSYHIQGHPHGVAEPAEAPDYAAVKAVQTGGEGTTVAVLDSGITRHPWLTCSFPSGSLRTDMEQWDFSTDRLPGHLGHGTFVAGIVLQYAPQTTILPGRVIDVNGDSYDAVLAEDPLGETLVETSYPSTSK